MVIVNEAIGNVEGIAAAKANIAECGNNDEELLKASQELYEIRVSEYGEGDEYTIDADKFNAIDLRKANRKTEARELLTKLLATSKLVLGPHHNATKEV
jgi:hypothetical protein